jgi:hypothetical protein
MAPFVTKNGEAVQVAGTDERFITVEAPNIRIKRPMTPSELLENRRVGTPIFANRAQIQAAARRVVRKDLARMDTLVTNRIEWLSCMAIRGQIVYQNPDLANFSITFQKPAAHTIVLVGTALWTDPLSSPRDQFRLAAELVSDEHGTSITVCVMGREAATAFVKNAKVSAELDNRRYDMTSTLPGLVNFSPEGALYLGMYAGIPCWQYSRQLEGQDLIRSKFAEFLVTGPTSGNVLYFGAISDHDALDNGQWVGERFSKSWVKKDPSVRVALLTSRPLPVMRRPGNVVSIQVVA